MIVKLDSKGPAIFKHRRLNTNGAEFIVWKLRTMFEDAELRRKEIDIYNLKPEDDPRNTDFGKILRKFELDELPQLIQVVLSDMSLIGPRPIPQNELDIMEEQGSTELELKILKESYKNSVKTGISGLNQSINPKRKNMHDRIRYDAYYSRKATLALDLYIVWRTCCRILKLDRYLEQ